MKQLNENIRPIIAILTVIFTFAYFFTAAFIKEVKDPQITIAVIGMNTIVFAFYMGSSQGSVNRQTTIEALQKKIDDKNI